MEAWLANDCDATPETLAQEAPGLGDICIERTWTQRLEIMSLDPDLVAEEAIRHLQPGNSFERVFGDSPRLLVQVLAALHGTLPEPHAVRISVFIAVHKPEKVLMLPESHRMICLEEHLVDDGAKNVMGQAHETQLLVAGGSPLLLGPCSSLRLLRLLLRFAHYGAAVG